jgi:pyruvate dehydrogenase E1 component alpha subunit
MHQATGQEEVAIGVGCALSPGDHVTSTHRGHAHCIGLDVPLTEMMAELFAKRQGTCRGMGGSMHLADPARGMLGAFGIVGAGIPIAVGAALSARLRGTDRVAVSFMGDGAVNEGVFAESLNMAALWRLPVLFVIENNQYAMSITVARSSAGGPLAERGIPFGVPGVQVDGNDVTAVYRAILGAVKAARAGQGPTVIEALTYRVRGHARFEAVGYRPAEEVEAWEAADPIERLGAALIEAGLQSETDLAEIRAAAEIAIRDAISFAETADDVGPTDYLAYVTSDGSAGTTDDRGARA